MRRVVAVFTQEGLVDPKSRSLPGVTANASLSLARCEPGIYVLRVEAHTAGTKPTRAVRELRLFVER